MTYIFSLCTQRRLHEIDNKFFILPQSCKFLRTCRNYVASENDVDQTQTWLHSIVNRK